MWQPVTVKCVYCRREIDGFFQDGNNEQIVTMQTGKVLAVPGEYNKRKGFTHIACKTGMEVEAQMNEPVRRTA